MGIGFQELLLIFLIIVLLFGARKLPDLARGMGEAIREFRKAAKEAENQEEQQTSSSPSQES